MLPFCIVFVLLWGLVFSDDCPANCFCNNPSSVFCIHGWPTISQVPISTHHLYLFQNDLVTLSRDDFQDLVELVSLDLSQNRLTEIPDRVFMSLSELKNLDMSSNNITHISKESFYGLVQLERLYLHENNIESIHWQAFEDLEMLLELKLQGNKLTTLPPLNFPRLLLLDLSQNNIPSLGPSDLHTPHLEALKLASLGLTYLDEELISSLRNLHELDLSINKLKEVPSALRIDSLKGLTKLSLASNPFLELNTEDFQKLVGLQELDLSGANLQAFPEGFFEIFPKLTELTAAENPFNCLCPLAWFPLWLVERKVNLKRPEETRCHFPLVNAGKMLSSLEQRDFGCPSTTPKSIAIAENTLFPQISTTSPETTYINAIQPPSSPTNEEANSSKAEPLVSISPTSILHFCPPNICLNGGTCHFHPQGHISCLCSPGTSGIFCENMDGTFKHLQPSDTDVISVPTPVMPARSDAISSLDVKSTSILLDLHRFIESRPNIRGIRLTYRNLSGPDRRPMILSLPTSYLEYTLRGLRPNCTYSVCASPLGEKIVFNENNTLEVGSCVEARTEGVTVISPEPWVGTNISLKNTLICAVVVLALVLALAFVAVTIICLRKKRQTHAGLELELGPADPDSTDLECIKTCLENGMNGTLPLKQPNEDQNHQPPPLLQQNGSSDYQALLIQQHCPSNNNVASLKPSYF